MNDVVKFKALVGLAQADGDFDSSEKKFIRHLADLQGLSIEEVKELLKNKEKMSLLVEELDFDDKIEILTYSVQLMKIDGKVFLSEIKFCEKIARALGFQDKAVGYLSSIIDSNPNVEPNFGRIKHRMRKYLTEAA